MGKKEKTVLIHARIPEADAAEVQRAAEEQPIAASFSRMVALIIRDWANRRRSQKKK
jgi:hypothetical protein